MSTEEPTPTTSTNGATRSGARTSAHRGAFALALALGACAQAPTLPAPSRYLCEEGGEFRVSEAPAHSGVVVELRGMHFTLEPAGVDASGERFGCSELTLWRHGREARLELRSGGVYRSCRHVQ